MIERKCVNCAFWNWEHGMFRSLGECRKEPPVVWHSNQLTPDGQPDYGSVFPRTDEDDWCGAFAEATF